MKESMGMNRENRPSVIYADSETDSNMLYATRIFIPDPFIYLKVRGKSFIIVTSLEYSRSKKEAAVDYVMSIEEAMEGTLAGRNSHRNTADLLANVLREKKIKCIRVPWTFPTGLADELRGRGIAVNPVRDPFFPARTVKGLDEVLNIKKALRAAEHGMKAAVGALREARIPRRKECLLLGGDTLTAERMRDIVHKAILEKQCTAKNTIVACGLQTYDPHQIGKGPLVANQPIIVDIFPRSNETGYYGDITRTFVKGTPSEWIRKAYEAVREGQRIAISHLSPGAQGTSIHNRVVRFFESRGFPTKRTENGMVGFFHGTGHGLGLALHEYPLLGRRPCILKDGHVVTVEPGIYYPEWGGVRLEDVVWLTKDGTRMLTRFPKILTI